VIRALEEIGDPLPGRWTYPAPGPERHALLEAGFEDVQAWLQPEPTAFEPGEPFEAFLEAVVLREHIARLPEAERRPFVRSVVACLPGPTLDYVRLNVVARRS
jgi:trans-aconitate 2-methyltransferase